MNDLDGLFEQLPVADIAKQLGVPKADASSAIAAALPALLQGLEANAQDPAGALSLISALQTKDASLVSGPISLADVDTDDGAKIVNHIFGKQSDQVASRLGGLDSTGAVGSPLMKKLLAILAPIVLAWVLKKVTGGSGSGGGKNGGDAAGDILGQVLGGALGGGGSTSGDAAGDILGQVLGGALGGGSSSGAGGGLGDLLGGLLGGGSR